MHVNNQIESYMKAAGLAFPKLRKRYRVKPYIDPRKNPNTSLQYGLTALGILQDDFTRAVSNKRKDKILRGIEFWKKFVESK